MASTWKGWPLNFSFTPSLRSSPVRTSASNAPKRTSRGRDCVSAIGELPCGPRLPLLFVSHLTPCLFQVKQSPAVNPINIFSIFH